MQNFPLNVVKTEVQHPVFDASMYLEELNVRESTREIIRKGWRWYMVELGGGLRTVTAQMLDERSTEDLLAIPGMNIARLREIRGACHADPGVMANLFPHIRRDETSGSYAGAFPEEVEQRFDAAGNPLPDAPKEDPADPADDPEA